MLGLLNVFPTGAIDVVSVSNADGDQLFPDATPMKVKVKNDAEFFKHPLEDSSVRVDHIVFNPIEVSLDMILASEQYTQTYKQIKEAYRGQTEIVVKTKADTFENLYLQAIPHEEDPDHFDSITITLILQETQFATVTATFQPQETPDTNTINKGKAETQTPTPTQDNRGSTLFRTFF